MKSILVTESDKKYQISISCRLLSKDILQNTSVISTAIENSVFYIKKYIEKNDFLKIEIIKFGYNDLSDSYSIDLIHENKLDYKDTLLDLFKNLLASNLLGQNLTKGTYESVFDKFFLPSSP